MPKLACPGCRKQYSLPASAMGKVAKCKACGKKFRVGKPKAKPTPRTPKSTPAPVLRSEPSDSFWDELSEYELMAPEPPSLAPLPAQQIKPKSKHRKGPAPWQRGCDMAYRAGCVGAVFLIGYYTYQLAYSNSQDEPEDAQFYSILISVFAMAVSGSILFWLAYRGMRLDAKSASIRMAGLVYIFAGIAFFAISVGVSLAVTVVWEGGFMIWTGGLAIGIAICVGGLLQAISGQDFIGEYSASKKS